jgi:hypothetical protein
MSASGLKKRYSCNLSDIQVKWNGNIITHFNLALGISEKIA